MDYVIARELLFALGIGLIIGFERGWRTIEDTSSRRSTGLRDFALVGLLGGVAGIGGEILGPWFIAVIIISIALLAVSAYWQECQHSQRIGITTELALLVTFALGVFCVLDFYIEAIAAATVVALLLRFKGKLHQTLQRLSATEVSATLQLLVIAAVVLPLLPDRLVGPMGGINPRLIGLLVLLIAGISFVGYFAIKVLGPRVGILTSAILGGLTSSTAVTVAFSQMAKRDASQTALLASGIALASATMAPRLLIVIAALNQQLAVILLWPLLVLGLIPMLTVTPVIWRFYHERHKVTQADTSNLNLSNPLELKAALFYGGLLSILIVAVRIVKEFLGDVGVYAIAGLSGLADVDAVSISLARGAQMDDLPLVMAAIGVVIAAVVNTLAKATISIFVGGRKLGYRVLIVFIPAAIAACLTLLFSQ
ncbi:MAG: MgtC/SapB family protein [Gammaproteobacteria bacterium]|nr:MgtC/SapB family protein [Gammaproteobacteria bacterium]